MKTLYESWSSSKELREFPSRVSVTLEKNVNIPTDKYNEYNEEYDGRQTLVIETNQVDWENEYQVNCITIPDMLYELRQYINNELRNANPQPSRKTFLYRLLEECSGWVVQDTNVNEL